jgi:hypothetical protein
MTTHIKYSDTFQSVLDEHFYSIGVTGAEALFNMLSEFNEGNLTEFLAEQEVTETEFLTTVNRLAVKWALRDVLNVRIGVRT